MRSVPTDEIDAQAPFADNAQLAVSTNRSEPASLSVVTAIAEATGTDPTTMEPLYQTVDTDALNRLLETDAALEVVFEYDGHAIEVGSDGSVTVDGEEIHTGELS